MASLSNDDVAAILRRRAALEPLALVGPYRLSQYDVTVDQWRNDTWQPCKLQLFFGGESHAPLKQKFNRCQKDTALPRASMLQFSDLLVAEVTAPGATCVDFVWEAQRHASAYDTAASHKQKRFATDVPESRLDQLAVFERALGGESSTQTSARFGNLRVHRGDIRRASFALNGIMLGTRLFDYYAVIHGEEEQALTPQNRAAWRGLLAMWRADDRFAQKLIESMTGIRIGESAGGWTDAEIRSLVAATNKTPAQALRDGLPLFQDYVRLQLHPRAAALLRADGDAEALDSLDRTLEWTVGEAECYGADGNTPTNRILFKRSGRHRVLAQLDGVGPPALRQRLLDSARWVMQYTCHELSVNIRAASVSMTTASDYDQRETMEKLCESYQDVFTTFTDAYVLWRMLRVTQSVSVAYFGSHHTKMYGKMLTGAFGATCCVVEIDDGASGACVATTPDNSAPLAPFVSASAPWPTRGWRVWWQNLHAAVHNGAPDACVRRRTDDAENEKEEEEEDEVNETEKEEAKEGEPSRYDSMTAQQISAALLSSLTYQPARARVSRRGRATARRPSRH